MRLLTVTLLLPACTQSDPKDSGAADSAPAPATALVYLHGEAGLYTWSEADGAALVGTFHDAKSTSVLPVMTDIAIDGDGALYAAADTALYRVDATNGACTPVTTLPDAGTGLTFLPDGRLLVAGTTLTVVDLATATSEPLLADSPYATSGDVVAVPDGSIHWSVVLGASDGWVRVDPTAGTATLVGEVGASRLWGVAYADGTLYAFSADGTSLAVDPTTGVGTLLRSDTEPWYGATTNPVRW